MPGKVVIAGSCLMALSMKSRRFPGIGESVLADVFLSEAGGKGANQAFAAARLGSEVSVIGCVGEDAYGDRVIKELADSGLNVAGLRKDGTTHTGIAFVLIDAEGRNMIEIAPGGNFKLSPADIDRNEHLIKQGQVVGFQLETNLDFVEYGIKRVHAMGVRTLLDPAPAQTIDKSVYAFLDYIKPNEIEASLLTGIPVVDVDSAFAATRWFLDHGVKNALVTLGERGVVVMNRNVKEHFVPPKVQVQDTTAAGDIFCGALMHRLAEGVDLGDACRFAVHAAALSVQVVGAMNAMPTLGEVIDFMRREAVK